MRPSGPGAPRLLAALIPALLCAAPLQAQTPLDMVPADSISALLTAIKYGVPGSPAFELLPGRASDIQHISTPTDLSGSVTQWLDGTHLRTGAALDYRLLGSFVGGLAQYRRSRWKQVMWRTVASLGTASPAKGSDDVLISAGLRLPLVDQGDPRLDPSFQQQMAKAGVALLADTACAPSTATEGTANISEACKKAVDDTLGAIQKRFLARKWNAFRVDVGLAGALQAAGGSVAVDSLSSHSGGVWLGMSGGLGSAVQVNVVGKALWTSTDSTTQEKARYVAGARVRLFPGAVGLSAEVAWVRSTHGDAALNDDWAHVAAVLELPLSRLGSMFKGQWLAVAYGGDPGRPNVPNKLSIGYSVYRNRILER